MRLRFLDRLSIRRKLSWAIALSSVPMAILAIAVFALADSLGLPAAAAFAIGLGGLISLLLAQRLERFVTAPLSRLASIARCVAAQGNYSLRAPRAHDDEIGQLTDDFNQMLDQIERRDRMLEEKVHNRTAELVAVNARLRHQAFHDTLTGLPNRALFDDRLEQAVAYCRRHQRKIAVMFLDLDNFKTVNDTLGHAAGDELLVMVAERIRQVLRDVDTVSRFGGDEFTILLMELSPDDYAEHIARRLIDNFEHPFFIQANPVNITTSIGITVFPDDVPGGELPDTLDLLKRNADTAMYTAKDAGKNTYQFFEEHMNRAAQEHLSMQLELRRALQANELRVLYQPVVNLRDGCVIGLEALARWQHPEQGLLPPSVFIPFAEKFGLIGLIDQWVLGEVCRQWRVWREAGVAPSWVSVNLSAVSLKNHNLVHDIAEVLREHVVPADAITIELTESQVMENAQEALALLEGLRELGLRLSIDDFGTGYSSLSHLKHLRVDTLKIDRSFVRDLSTNPGDVTIISTIIAMARNLKLRVIAEGVETPAQLAVLHELACDSFQGYLCAAPLTADDVPARLRTLFTLPPLGAVAQADDGPCI